MHSAIISLLDLHAINIQRQRLIERRAHREERRRQADKALAKFCKIAEDATQKVAEQGALIRQYTADVERCEARIQELRSQQMTAKSNKEYLDCINGIEEAKAEKKLREESLSNLNASVAQLQEKADAAEAKRTEIQGKYDKLIEDLRESDEHTQSSAELERIYQEKRRNVDPAFLEVYERLILAKHQTPLVSVDPQTRATPLGQTISHNDCERIRLGQLVTDPQTNGILYLNEVETSAETPLRS